MDNISKNIPALYKTACIICREACEIFFQSEVVGAHNIPMTGPLIIAPNHQSFVDIPLVGSNIPREDVFYVARDTLFASRFSNWLLNSINGIPIKRDDRSDVSGLKRLLTILKQGHALVLYPEGTRSIDGKIQNAKAGIGLIACKTKATIVPTRVFNTREVFGKRNDALILGPSTTLIYSKPLLPAHYDPGPSPDRFQIAADRILEHIRTIHAYEPRTI